MTRYAGYQPPATPMPYRPPHPSAPLPLPPPMPMPPPGPRRATRRAAIVLGALAALLFLGGGTFAALYVMATDDHDAVTERLGDRRAELDGLTERLTLAEDERDRAERRNDDLEATRTELTECVEAAQHYLWDDLTGAELDTAFDTFFAQCQ